MAKDKDFYTILGIPKNSSQEDIKKAYRKLAHQYHPDKQGGDEAKFKEINEAYQVLSDPKKRSQYDQFGSVPPGGFGGQGFGGFDFSQGFGGFNQGQNFDFENIFDIFGDVFGGRRGASERAESGAGSDLQVNLTISLHDAAHGITENIDINKDVICNKCDGSGAESGKGMVDCSNCKGRGEIRESVSSIFGNISRVSTCGVCRGKGKVPKENCHECKGEGKKRERKTIEIKIPAGINDGEALGIRGEGQAGFRGSRPGNLYVQVRVEPDKRFKRVGNDIIFELNIKVTDALLGANVKVPTLDGEEKLEIPSGAQSGDELRLRGQGIRGGHKGDQIIKIKVEIPKKLSSKAKKLIEELSKEIQS